MLQTFKPLFLLTLALALLAGCRSAENKPLPIGVIVPLTGDAASYGESSRQGIDLAIQEINEASGVNGRPLRAIYEDSQAQPREGVNAAQRLITVQGVPAIIGGVTSGVTLAVAPIAEQNEVVLISPTASSPELTTAGDYIFRNFPSDNYEGEVMADFLRDRGVQSVAIAQVQNDYGEGVSSVFAENLQADGGQIALHERYAQESTDFRDLISKLRAASPDAIYAIGYYTDVALLVRQAREAGIETPFYATTTVEDPQFLEIGGEAVEGVIYPLASAYSEESQEPAIQQFTRAFREMFEADPGFVAAQAYDCVYLIKQAIELGGGVTGAEIREGMAQISDFEGASGTTTFDEHGDVRRDLTIKVVRDGAFRVLQPEAEPVAVTQDTE